MNKINLLVNLYVDPNPDRQSELEKVFLNNIENPFIDSVLGFVTDSKDALKYSELIPQNKKLVIVLVDHRPTFNDYFKKTRELDPNCVNIIANGDICFDDTLNLIKDIRWTPMYCFALTRWDTDGNGNAKFLENIDSQDCWIFPGNVQEVQGADFCLGHAGCDNAIANRLCRAGWSVFNPSIDLKTYHLHNTPVLNYLDHNGEPKQTIPSPYILLRPCTFEDTVRSYAEKFYEHRP